ncbi:MAG: hypothetical protein JNM66_03005 [Bryobacterales bacterium]|nr:hypothetical protein [Bryobacterales bacterium]
MNERPLAALLALIGIGLFGFFVFPGHTYLHQDSQIYLPMMERLVDGRVLGNDLIATHPHLSFTVYDEIAVGVRKLTGLDFQPVLVAQQIVTRLLGLLGVFLLAQSAGLGYSASTLAAGLYGLGATVIGPSVLTVEYEPTPRTFALPMMIFAAGLAATRLWPLAGAAAFAGFLYHPPTVLPVLLLLLVYVLLPWHLDGRWRFLGWILGAVAVMLVAAKFQAGIRLEQDFFSQVSPDVEKLQRMRASYVFVGSWFGQYWLHHLFLAGVGMAAWWRAGERLEGFGQFLLGLLPVLGLLSLLISWVAMDWLGWGLMPQLQPARAVLWTTFAAVVTSAIAAGAAEGIGERVVWLLVPLAVAVHTRPVELLWPSNEALLQHLGLVVLLAMLGAFSLRMGAWAPGLVVIGAMFLIPNLGGVRNYPQIHSAELDELSQWARRETPIGAVFHFPDAGKELYPGIFRARAARAVWVDWKGGGQVNFMEPLAREWWRRWSALPAGSGEFEVRKAGRCGSGAVFANAKFCVGRKTN